MTQEIKVPIKLSASGGDQSARELLKIDEAILKANRSIDRFEKSGIGAFVAGAENIDFARQKVVQLDFQIKALDTRLEELNEEFKNVNRNRPLKDVEEDAINARLAYSQLAAEISKTPIDLREDIPRMKAGYLGDLDTSIQTFATSISTSGTLFGGTALGRDLTKAGAGVGLSGDLFAISEQIPLFSAGLATLSDRTLNYIELAGQQAKATTGIAASAANAVAPLGATASGLAALTVSVAPLVLAGGALAGTLFLVKKELDENKKGVEGAIRAEKDRLEALRFTTGELERLTAEEVRIRKEGLEQEIADAQSILKTAQSASLGALTEEGIIGKTFGAAANNLNGTGTALGEIATQTKIIEEKSRELEAIANSLTLKTASEQGVSNVEKYLTGLDNAANRELENFRAVREVSSETARVNLLYAKEELRLNEIKLETLRETITASDKALQDITNGITVADPATLERLTAENEGLKTAYDELLPTIQADRRAIEEYQQTVIPGIAATERHTAAIEAQQVEVERLAKLEENLADKRKDLQQSIKAVDQQIADFTENQARQDAIKAETAALKASQDSRLKDLDSRYATLKAERDIQTQRAKLVGIEQERTTKITEINSKYFADNLKSVQDNALKEKRIQEDANRERLKLLRDGEADLFEAAANNNIASFISRQQQLSRDLTDLDSDSSSDAGRRAEDFRLATESAIKARDAEVQKITEATRQKFDIEVAAKNQGLTIEQRYQQDKLALQATFANESLKLQQQQEQAKINMQLQAFEATRSQFQALMNVNTSQQRVERATRPDAQIAYGRYGQIGRMITAAATGDIFPARKPQLVLLGDGQYDEAVYPIKPSRGFDNAARSMGMGGAAPINVYLGGVQVGAISTPADLDALESRVYRGVIQAQKIAHSEVRS